MIRPTLLLAATLTLASCGGPPPPPPTLVNATLTATADANDGAPVALRIYQLVSPAAFQAAEFFPLFNTDTAALKDDIVKRDDILLAPGATKTLSLAPPDRATAIGIFAAYKDYQTTTWRAVTPIPAHATTTLTITVARSGISAKTEPAKP